MRPNDCTVLLKHMQLLQRISHILCVPGQNWRVFFTFAANDFVFESSDPVPIEQAYI